MKNQSGRQEKQQQYCCSKECIKTVLIFFNLLLSLCGLAVFVLGLWLLVSRRSYVPALTGEVFYLSHFLLTACGALVLIFSLVGFLGIFTNNVRLLWVYSLFLVALLLAELCIGGLGFMFAGSLQQRLLLALKETMLQKYRVDAEVTEAVDELHESLRCCGSGSWRDWRESQHYAAAWNSSAGRELTPISCCRSRAPGCSANSHPSNIYHIGCSTQLAEQLFLNIVTVAVCALGLAVVLLLSIVLSFSLVHSLRAARSASKRRLG